MVHAVTEGFRWQDGERLIRFGRGALADAPELLGDGYLLLTTPRAAQSAPAVVERAVRVEHVGAGRVDDLAGDLLEPARSSGAGLFVALGGGRVVDTAKALASALAGTRVAAVPTTLSAAEMTTGHRRARGAPQDTPGVRPAIVLNDPALSASQPPAQLAASAANALAHAYEGPMTVAASPVPTLAAHEASRLIAGAWSGPEPDRDALALGALLSGYAIDGPGYGLHHVLSQTLVRIGGAGHGPANAAMLPHTTRALRRRRPDRVDRLAVAIGADPAEVAAQLAARARARRLRDIGVDRDKLDACVEAAAARPDLARIPPAPDEAEIRALYEAAW
jgi:alcohol dehydrogenase class IV